MFENNPFIVFACSLGIVLIISAFNRLFKPGDWYAALSKPSWTPPNRLFGVVWPCLYIMMGISLGLFWLSAPHPFKSFVLFLFSLQLFFNFVWSYLFFGLRRMDWAFIDILVLGVSIGGTVLAGWGISRTGSLLLTPYFFWILFAAVLNWKVWKLNTAKNSQ